jgi:putative membrane protein
LNSGQREFGGQNRLDRFSTPSAATKLLMQYSTPEGFREPVVMSPAKRNAQDGGVDPNITTVPETGPVTGRAASITEDAVNVARGFCMGAADTVPGVSGGTVALILGHYQRLIDAVSRVDRAWFSLLAARRWHQAWQHIDARFLAAIGGGIGLGIVTLAGLMHWLLDEHLPATFAVFFGLIVASVVIVRRQVSRWTPACWLGLATGVVAALVIGRLSPTSGSDSLIYLFVSASVAICAMILPGISGAFILLLLGVYHPITGLIKDAAGGQITVTALTQLGTFGLGCLFGLLAFSKLLHWLLEHHRSLTMASLIGLMIGSVEKLWPLQVPTAETAHLKSKERVLQTVPISEWDGSLTLLAVLAVGAAAFVLVLDRIAPEEIGPQHAPPEASLNAGESDD